MAKTIVSKVARIDDYLTLMLNGQLRPGDHVKAFGVEITYQGQQQLTLAAGDQTKHYELPAWMVQNDKA